MWTLAWWSSVGKWVLLCLQRMTLLILLLFRQLLSSLHIAELMAFHQLVEFGPVPCHLVWNHRGEPHVLSVKIRSQTPLPTSGPKNSNWRSKYRCPIEPHSTSGREPQFSGFPWKFCNASQQAPEERGKTSSPTVRVGRYIQGREVQKPETANFNVYSRRSYSRFLAISVH